MIEFSGLGFKMLRSQNQEIQEVNMDTNFRVNPGCVNGGSVNPGSVNPEGPAQLDRRTFLAAGGGALAAGLFLGGAATGQEKGREAYQVPPLPYPYDALEPSIDKTTMEIQASRPGWDLYEDGCPGGETPAQIRARAGDFISVAADVKGRSLAFSHGHFLRAVAIAWVQLEIKAAGALYLDVATLSIVREEDHGRVIAVWNAP